MQIIMLILDADIFDRYLHTWGMCRCNDEWYCDGNKTWTYSRDKYQVSRHVHRIAWFKFNFKFFK